MPRRFRLDFILQKHLYVKQQYQIKIISSEKYGEREKVSGKQQKGKEQTNKKEKTEMRQPTGKRSL